MALPPELTRREENRAGLWGFSGEYGDAIAEAIASINAYGRDFDTWAITYSGGKDSSALLTFVIWAIEAGHIQPPKQLVVLYADTLMELPPLAITARAVMREVAKRGFTSVIVEPEPMKRMLVQMLGRGIPHPTNRRRWCTRVLKAEPMAAALAKYPGAMVLTGVRKGESAARDERISTSCSTNDGECGQGWFQQSRNALAPFLSWRVCHIWRWIYDDNNPMFRIRDIYDVYRADEITDVRTGCIKCQLVHEDVSFKYVVKNARWSWLEPYHELEEIYEWLQKPAQRLRKVEPSQKVDGSYRDRTSAPLGPSHTDARIAALERILELQAAVKKLDPNGEGYDLIPVEDEALIRRMILHNVYPRGWQGDEPRGDAPYQATVVTNGKIAAVQPLLPGFESEAA